MKKPVTIPLVFMSGSANIEQIISKEDADNIFSMDKVTWERYVQEIEAPTGWKQSLKPMESGSAIMSFNQDMGHGISIKPFFDEKTKIPDMLIVGSYYPDGSLYDDTEKLINSAKKKAESDLGDSYWVDVVLANTPPLEGVELHLVKKVK